MSDTSAVLKKDDEDAAAKADQVNILVVDDLPEKLEVYRSILEELGQNLMTAGSGDEALKLVLKHEFAVILLDVNMPGMDGFETANLIRGRRKSASTPIIFLTAFTDDFHAAQGYASGAVDYLPTPVMPEILKAKVRVFIELSRMRQQAALQAEERARRAAAEEADRRKDEFLGMLAHELRNPLGPIRNAVHLLQITSPDDKRQEMLRDMIDRQVVHMVRLIDDLLDSTRIARGLILLRRERCDLVTIVSETAGDYCSIFEDSGMELEVEVPPEPLWIEGDRTRLAQAIGNLLHNAHKFSDQGSKTVIRLESANHGRTAVLSVTDTGVGIEPDMLDCIFEVFRQADQGLDRKRGGLGLGLALVKGLIQLHGGDVAATSKGLGGGSTFTIRIPASTRPVAVPSNDHDSVTVPDTKCRILVIEDNHDAAESLRMLLDYEGYEVQAAHNGQDGIEAARNFHPRVVLCDIGLPGMDGYQVARTIRQDAELSSAYMIALTGYGREEDRQQASDAGFDLHLTKPLDYNALFTALAQCTAAA